jgi:hypothetical protein
MGEKVDPRMPTAAAIWSGPPPVNADAVCAFYRELRDGGIPEGLAHEITRDAARERRFTVTTVTEGPAVEAVEL